MQYIKLDSCEANEGRILYRFSVSDSIRRYFKLLILDVAYNERIDNVPLSILNIVFVSSMLPLAWMLNAEIIVDELDEDFYNCLPDVVHGYGVVYPKWHMGGHVTVAQRIKNVPTGDGKTATFFSAGVDAVHTLLAHRDEKPDLLLVWGADIAVDNEQGWRIERGKVQEFSDKFHLPMCTIRSNYRQVDDESLLEPIARVKLNDGYWHGIKHSLPLLGMSAPLAWKRKYRKVYIASTHCPEFNPPATCASNPWVDNAVRFCGTTIEHFGFESNRQAKVDYIVKAHPEELPIHVCWITQSGENCCKCEKCFRTITEFLAAGADPAKYGFKGYEQYYKFNRIIPILVQQFNAEKQAKRLDLNLIWDGARRKLIFNREMALRSPHKKVFRWMMEHEFVGGAELLRLPPILRISRKSGQMLTFGRKVLKRIYSRGCK